MAAGPAHTVTTPSSSEPRVLRRTDALKQLPKRAGEYLLEVIMRRYETRSTIMISNRPLDDLGTLLQDVPTAGAILDRFMHRAQVIAITSESYWLKNAPLTKTKSQTLVSSPDNDQ